jgi:hypothetical protein
MNEIRFFLGQLAEANFSVVGATVAICFVLRFTKLFCESCTAARNTISSVHYGPCVTLHHHADEEMLRSG